MLCFSDEDAELWENDPHEYIRKVGGGGRWLADLLCMCGRVCGWG